MERMEVDQCAGAGGGALRRSNSAPMIASVRFVVLHSRLNICVLKYTYISKIKSFWELKLVYFVRAEPIPTFKYLRGGKNKLKM